MATITRGKTFISGETVEPADMHQLVEQATIAFVTAEDTDDSTLEASGGKLRVKDGGISAAKLGGDIILVPAGAVMPFARATAPTGWLIANGDVVPNGSGTVQGVTADFSALYAALSTSFGTAGTLPDLRGIFVRGSDSQTISGTTYSGTFAAKQGDAMQGHRHSLLPNFRLHDLSAANYILGGTPNVQLSPADGTGVGDPSTDTVNGTPRTASETRPANIALLYCIKF